MPNALDRQKAAYLSAKHSLYESQQEFFSPKDTLRLKHELETALGKSSFGLYWQQLSSFLMGKINRAELNSALSPLLGMQYGPLHKLHNQMLLSIHYNARPPWLGKKIKATPTTILGTKRKAEVVDGPVIVSTRGDKRFLADGSVEGSSPIVLRKDRDSGTLHKVVLLPENSGPPELMSGFREHEMPFHPQDNPTDLPQSLLDLNNLPTHDWLKKRVQFICREEGLRGKEHDFVPMTALLTAQVNAPKREMVSESTIDFLSEAIEIYVKNILQAAIRKVHPKSINGFGEEDPVPKQDRLPKTKKPAGKRPTLTPKVPWSLSLRDVKAVLDQSPTLTVHNASYYEDKLIIGLAVDEALSDY